MKISSIKLNKNLIVFDDINSEDQIGVYDTFSHSHCLMHKAIYSYLLDKDDLSNIADDLSDEQISILYSHNVLIDDDYYLSKEFEHPFKERVNWIKKAYIHPTMNCNLACEYCYICIDAPSEFPTLSADKWMHVIEKLHAEGLESINITGGEPLLYPDILKIIKFAKSLGIRVALLTNGTLLDKYDGLFDLIDHAIVSLDGLTNSMRVGIEKHPVFENIMSIAKNYPDKISVRSVVVKGFEEEVQSLEGILKTNEIRHLKSICLPSRREDEKLIPDYDKYDLLQRNFASPNRCGAGDTIVAVNSVGEMFPCQLMMKPELKMADMLSDSWKEDYLNSTINDDLESFSTHSHPKCQSCFARWRCNGGCRAAAYSFYGKLDSPLEFLCDFHRKSTELAMREYFEKEAQENNE